VGVATCGAVELAGEAMGGEEAATVISSRFPIVLEQGFLLAGLPSVELTLERRRRNTTRPLDKSIARGRFEQWRWD
jgi:hypothetical protein